MLYALYDCLIVQVVGMLRDYCNRIQEIDNETMADEVFNEEAEETETKMAEMDEEEYFDWGLTNDVTQADILAMHSSYS